MCKESVHFNIPLRKKLKALSIQEISKVDNHHHHDDSEEKAHNHCQDQEKAHTHHYKHENIQAHMHAQTHEYNPEVHTQHDDVVSLAHRHHDHSHPIHLQQGGAGFRQHTCHAGDGHDHGAAPVLKGAAPLLSPSFGGGHHHEEGEHEHCPHCDEHLVDEKCPKCGYKHQH